MNRLQKHHLLRFCKKWGLDTHLVDSTLTYSENKTILMSQVHTFDLEAHRAEFRAYLEQYDAYVKEHFLEYYVYATRRGETKSTDVGEPIETAGEFSLAELVRTKKQRV